jgi:hypothetical protein
MPASLPGSTLAQNKANPSAGQAVIFDALSGPKGSPLDVRIITGWVGGSPQYANDAAGQSQVSTGAMCTGIGFGCNVGVPIRPIGGQTPAQAIRAAGFTDDTGAGLAYPNSSIIYMGGGRSTNKGVANPYTEGYIPCNAGNGGSRDGGAGPAFTGFVGKFVTATGAVANGAAVETGWINRSGVAIGANDSVFGSSNAAQAAAS